MSVIDEEIEQLEAAGFKQLSPRGRGPDWLVFQCMRTGLRIGLPMLGDGYFVWDRSPNSTELKAAGSFDGAFGYIQQQPDGEVPPLPKSGFEAEEEMADSVRRWAKDAEYDFDPPEPETPSEPGEDLADVEEPEAPSALDTIAPTLIDAVLVAGAAAFAWGATLALVPVYSIVAAFALALPSIVVALLIVVSGLLWGLALARRSGKERGLFVGAAAAGALLFALFEPFSFVAPPAPVLGAAVAASIMAVGRGNVRGDWSVKAAILGAVPAAIIAAFTFGDSIEPRLWATALLAHAIISLIPRN